MREPKALTILGVLGVGALAAAVAASTYQRSAALRDERALLTAVEISRLRIEIWTPRSGEHATTWVVPLSGRVVPADESAGMAREALDRDQIAIVPLVRPLVNGTQWWVQERPKIHPDGTVEGALSLGDQQGLGVGIAFEVVIVAVPRGSLLRGEKLSELPLSYASSERIVLRRDL